MELTHTLPSLSPTTATSLLFLLVLSLYILRKKITNPNFKAKLPPGPWTLPFIGSLHHLATASLPHHAFRDLARLHGPIMLLRAGETDLVVISSREAAQEVMKTQDINFANRPIMSAPNIICYGCTDIAFSPHGPYWRQLRRICLTELLSPKRVKSFNQIREQEIHSMLKEIYKASSDQTPVNFSTKVAGLANNIVCRAAFGEKCKKQGRFLEILKEAVELASGFSLSDLFPSLSWLDVKMRQKLERIRRDMDEILDETVKDHLSKENKGGDKEMEDLADVLIHAKEQGDLEVPITFDNIKAVILDLFTGGTDTSSSTIEWAMAELLRHPQKMAKAQAEVRQAAERNTEISNNAITELNYLKLVIKETLRLHPPVPLLVPRVCKETCQILDYTIPANTRIVINAWALGRNREYWEDDAEEFKPERFQDSFVDFKGNNFEFVPFGSGRRICPGIGFGMAVVEAALARLLLHFDWKLPDGVRADNLDMSETFGATSNRKEPLYLIPISHIPLHDA
ncbi:hypothetical protein LUZ60_015948 [Juncus effusus]|nr:hypothetical protein LUZ60_015948 [Juncus effusus]